MRALGPTDGGLPGWFGKQVALGDFAHRRLPQHFVGACDRWLSEGLSASRQSLGDRWLDAYLGGPVWRFMWAGGVFDAQWWYGVLMPSVDAVGRYFPLVVASARPGPPGSPDAMHALDEWFRAASEAALGTLAEGATLESFEADLARCRPLPVDDAPHAVDMTGASIGIECHMLRGADSTSAWAQVLTTPLFVHRYAGHSFWWPMRQMDDDSQMNVIRGLPDPAQFTLMLEGRW